MTRRLTTTQQGYGWPWQKLRLHILRRDRYTCHYCGAYARSVDHVVPKIEGGTDHPTNLVASCTPCNSARSMAWVQQHRGRGGRGTSSKNLQGRKDNGDHQTGDRFFLTAHPRLTSSAEHGLGATASGALAEG